MRLREWLRFCREEQGEDDEEVAARAFHLAATPELRPQFDYDPEKLASPHLAKKQRKQRKSSIFATAENRRTENRRTENRRSSF